MTTLNPLILEDTKKLLQLYRENESFRGEIQNKSIEQLKNMVLLKRPVQLYVEVISSALPQFKDYYRQIIKSPTTKEGETNKIVELFDEFTKSEANFSLLEKVRKDALTGINSTTFLENDLEEINKAEQTDSEGEKEKRFKEYLERIEREIQLSTHQAEKEEEKEKEEKLSEPEVKIPEKIHPKYSSPEDLAKLEKILNKPEEPVPQSVLTDQYGRPIKSTPPKPEIEKNWQATNTPSEPNIKYTAETPSATATFTNISQATSKIKTPRVVKNLSSFLQIKLRKLLARYGLNLLSGGVGATVGYVITSGNPLGALAGGVIMSNPRGITTNLGSNADNIMHRQGMKNRASGAIKNAGTKAAGLAKKSLLRWLVIPGLIALGVVLLILIPLGGLANNSLFPPDGVAYSAPPPGGGDISSCSFTRSGVSAPFKSLILLGWISEAAAKEGIPAAIIASIARHESPEFTTNATNDHEAIKTNHYCNPGLEVFCVQNNQRIHGGECTADEIAAGASTAQAMGLMQLLNIYYPGVDLCNITDNIARGTALFKEKLAGGSATSETEVKKAVCRYFGIDDVTCPYGGGDYAQDVWNDYQNCKPVTPPAPGEFDSYFCQADPAWQSRSYQGQPFMMYACGPTSMAMVFKHFGVNTDPGLMFDQFADQGFLTAQGTRMEYLLNEKGGWLTRNGFETRQISTAHAPIDINVMRNFLNNGYLVIGSQYLLMGESHIFVVSAINSDNLLLLQDPASYKNGPSCTPNQWRPLDRILPDSVGQSGNWMYAYAIKKIR